MLAIVDQSPAVQPANNRHGHAPWRSDPDHFPRRGQSSQIGRDFERHGGVASAEDVALLMRRHCEQPVSQLARWIVGSKIVHFVDQSQTWVPLFQFDLDDMSIRPAVIALLGELGTVMDSDELAAWFVTCNEWLSDEAPIDMMEADFPAVLDAARADRFVTRG
ncbi:MAG: hypothetical protein ABI564_08560 [Ideonella sp.]